MISSAFTVRAIKSSATSSPDSFASIRAKRHGAVMKGDVAHGLSMPGPRAYCHPPTCGISVFLRASR
ncbi:MAG: hypothetical protein LW806_12165 [Planctomycetaceae bacterium]|nr:hypothetical protein [Planctomycetaceae bacterium]